jgi:hypothetical protein
MCAFFTGSYHNFVYIFVNLGHFCTAIAVSSSSKGGFFKGGGRVFCVLEKEEVEISAIQLNFFTRVLDKWYYCCS